MDSIIEKEALEGNLMAEERRVSFEDRINESAPVRFGRDFDVVLEGEQQGKYHFYE